MPTRAVAFTATFLAVDSATGRPKTGDAANITPRLVKDGVSAALTTGTVTEVDATNLKGLYKVSISATEADCDELVIGGVSATAGIDIYPTPYGMERLPNAAPGASNGVALVGSNVGAATSVTGSVGSVTGSVGSIAGVTFPTNFASLVIDSTGRVNAFLIGIITTVLTEGATGRLAAAWQAAWNVVSSVWTSASVNQTGDAFNRLGAPAGASVSADIASVKTSVGAVTGAVGSVTGAVGSVTGNIGGNVNGNVAGSVGSVAGNVGGSTASVTGDVGGKVLGGGVGTITGSGVQASSVVGSVGSVVGAVGSVTGAVGSVTGSVGSVVGTVGGNVTGSVGSVAGGIGGDVAGKVLGGGTGTITGDGVRAASVTGAVGSVTGAVGSVTGAVGSVTANVNTNANATETGIKSKTDLIGTNTADSPNAITAQANAASAASSASSAASNAASAATAATTAASQTTGAAIRADLGMASANMDAQFAALSASAGTGVYALTLTITDGTRPLQNALVNVTINSSVYSGRTNVSGVVVLSPNEGAGSYGVKMTCPGYLFTPTTLIVSGNLSHTYVMTAITITPSSPGLSSGYTTCFDVNGNPKSGVVYTRTLVTPAPGETGNSISSLSVTATSDANGLVVFTNHFPNAMYSIQRLNGPALQYQAWYGTFPIPDVPGPDA